MAVSKRRNSDAQEQFDAELLDEYSYAQLRRFCKEQGVPATGKAVELRERLRSTIAVHGGDVQIETLGNEEDTALVSNDGPRHTPFAGMRARALATPLPSGEKVLPNIKTRVEGPRVVQRPRRGVFRSLLVSLLKLLVLLAAVLYGLNAYACRLPVSQDWIQANSIARAACDVASTASREVKVVTQKAVESIYASPWRAYLKDLLIKGVEDAQASTMQWLERLDAKKTEKIHFDPLNKSVLESVILYNAGYASVVSHLEDVWAGVHISSNDKANVVLFACTSSENCKELESDIASVSDAVHVLKILVDDRTSRGDLQAQIASFLKDTPTGIVLIPHVERWSPTLLSVLNNCMGEGGSLIQDGSSVSTTSATWLLTARVDLGAEDLQSSVKLSLGVKGALLPKGKQEKDEMAQAVLMAFRRRVDVVALGNHVV
jgi:hypothetical protein